MANHVHFLVVPEQEESLARVFGRAHSDYARYANLLRRGCGHFWQGRYYSCPVEEGEAWWVLAYLERNPVRAGLVRDAEEWSWSSARAHCGGEDATGRLDMAEWGRLYTPECWREVLATGVNEEALRERIREATGLGLPLGTEGFVRSLGMALNRDLTRRPPGRPPKERGVAAAATGETV
jgi:putative transposase